MGHVLRHVKELGPLAEFRAELAIPVLVGLHSSDASRPLAPEQRGASGSEFEDVAPRKIKLKKVLDERVAVEWEWLAPAGQRSTELGCAIQAVAKSEKVQIETLKGAFFSIPLRRMLSRSVVPHHEVFEPELPFSRLAARDRSDETLHAIPSEITFIRGKGAF